jgi:hypothetical protein
VGRSFQDNTLYFPEERMHGMEQAWGNLDNFGKPNGFKNLPDYGRKPMRGFSHGFVKFVNPPSLGPVLEAPPHAQEHARTATISHPQRVQERLNDWQIIAPPPPPVPSATQVGAWPAPISVPSYPARGIPERFTFSGHSLEAHKSSAHTGPCYSAPS